MARLFNGTTDVIAATVTATNTEDWTAGAWIAADTIGENGFGRIFDNGRQRLFSDGDSTSFSVTAQQDYTTTVAEADATGSLTFGNWWCVIATFQSADKKCRIYIGSLADAMAEPSYFSQTAGVGSRVTGGTGHKIGNRSAGDRTFDGSIALHFFDARLWTLGEMEEFRIGARPPGTSTLRGFWPLDSPTASRAEDMSLNAAHGTVTGTTVSGNPPISSTWGGVFASVVGVISVPATVPLTVITGQGTVHTPIGKPLAPLTTVVGNGAVQTPTGKPTAPLTVAVGIGVVSAPVVPVAPVLGTIAGLGTVPSPAGAAVLDVIVGHGQITAAIEVESVPVFVSGRGSIPALAGILTGSGLTVGADAVEGVGIVFAYQDLVSLLETVEGEGIVPLFAAVSFTIDLVEGSGTVPALAPILDVLSTVEGIGEVPSTTTGIVESLGTVEGIGVVYANISVLLPVLVIGLGTVQGPTVELLPAGTTVLGTGTVADLSAGFFVWLGVVIIHVVQDRTMAVAHSEAFQIRRT